jgi:uncharacterized protein involved in oxidation of intracellular sulfur
VDSFEVEERFMPQLLFMGTAGLEDPTRATIPFHLAKAAKESGIDVAIVLGADASLLVRPGVRENVHGVGFPPLKDLYAHARTTGIPLYV